MMHLAYEILLLCSILYGFVFIETSSFLQHLLNTQQQSQIRSIYELQRCQSELRDDMSCVLDMGYGRIHRGKMKMRMSSSPMMLAPEPLLLRSMPETGTDVRYDLAPRIVSGERRRNVSAMSFEMAPMMCAPESTIALSLCRASAEETQTA